MQVIVHTPDPGFHWLAVGRMLANRDDLRDDVTLRVDPDRLCFVDRHGEVTRELPQGKWTGDAIADADVMLEFLAWIEKEFAIPLAEGRFGCPIRGSRRQIRPRMEDRNRSEQDR